MDRIKDLKQIKGRDNLDILFLVNSLSMDLRI